MATNWKTLTDAQKAELNAKRREKYAANPEPKKEAEKEKYGQQVATKINNLILRLPKGRSVPFSDLSEEDRNYYLARANKVKRHIVARDAYWSRLINWQKSGGKFPWPSMQDKFKKTETFMMAMMKMGRKCCECGETQQWDWMWRVSPKTDFLGFCPFTQQEWDKVNKNPENYEVYCLKCAWDLTIYLRFWVIGAKSPRYVKDRTTPVFPAPFIHWEKKAREMYPPGWNAMKEKIMSGKVRSYRCQSKNPQGKYVDTFLINNRYYQWVGHNPRDVAWQIGEQAAQVYKESHPDANPIYWGGTDYREDRLHVRNNEFISPEFRAFLQEFDGKKESVRAATA